MWVLLLVILFLSVGLTFKKYSKKQRSRVPGLSRTSKTHGNLEDIAAAGSMVEFLRNLHARFGPIASFWYKDVYTVSLADSKYFKKTEKMFDRHKALFEFAEPLISKKSSQYLNGDFGKQRFKGRT